MNVRIKYTLFILLFCLVLCLFPVMGRAEDKHNTVIIPTTYTGRTLDNPLYDLSIRKWASIYTPEYPWYWNKAQLAAESALNPNAASHVGAKGLGQFMPLTWKDMQRELGFNASVWSVPHQIQAHAYYMAKLRNNFKRERPEKDRHSLALASYNAGLGNVLKAQKLAGGSLYYTPMIEALPKVTGQAHSKETRTYVNRIWQYVDYYDYKYKGE